MDIRQPDGWTLSDDGVGLVSGYVGQDDIADARERLVAMPGCLQLDSLQGLPMSRLVTVMYVVEAEILEPHWPDNTPTPPE